MFRIIVSTILGIGLAIGGWLAHDTPQVGLSTLQVVQGGTGATSFTSGECLVGNGTGAITTTSCGSGSFSGNLVDISDVSTTTTPTPYGDVLYYTGDHWSSMATSSLGISGGGGDFAWTPTTNYGANANSTSTPIWFKDNLFASSTAYLTTLILENELADGYFDKTGDWNGTFDSKEGSYYLDANNLNNFGSPFYTYFNATNTDALSEGSNNFYATQSRWDTFWNASTTLDSVTSIPNLTVTESQISDLQNYSLHSYASTTYVWASDWTTIDDYPSGCSAGNYVQAIGDTLTCTADSDTTYTAGTNLTLAGTQFNVDDPFSVTNLTATYASTTALSVNGLLDLTGGATTTSNNGFNITDGCFAVDGTCITGGGSSAFTGLNDTPSSYSGKGGQAVKVNSAENALEFVDVSLFEIDISGDLEPITATTTDPQFELDASDNIQPK